MTDTEVLVDGRAYRVSHLLGKGKSAYSWLITDGAHSLVLKKMHDEKVDYYTFTDKLAAELDAYRKLKASGIALPRLICHSETERYLIKEYIDGPTAAELVARQEITLDHFRLVYAMHDQLRRHGLHIDYFPTNFIFSEGRILLIDYECHSYNAEWDFENWGIYYWLNVQGMKEHLEAGSTDKLNPPGSPKPYTIPFEAERHSILTTCGAMAVR
jgi:predicted Ser/Thr protein kinase